MTEILDNLHQLAAFEMRPDHFDLIVDMAGQVSEDAPATIMAWHIVDGPLPKDMEKLHRYAEEVARAVQQGQRVAVVCAAGQNRSGLVVGLALKELGFSGPEAVRLIQRKRPGALVNSEFREYVRSGLSRS